MERQYYVYIMTNKSNTVLYTGVTNNLKRRAYEHKEKLVKGFTNKYKIVKLVYYEVFSDPRFNKEVQHLGKEGTLSECTNKHINISPAKRETI